MTTPAMLIVDNDPGVLSALKDDLSDRYGKRYTIVGRESGMSALDQLDQWRQDHVPVAVLLADTHLADMSGVNFLQRASDLFPTARRVLLTSYEHVDEAVRAVDEINLDYYLLKPCDPPERQIYPALDVLLESWRATYQPPFDGLRVIGHRWSPATHEIRDFLARYLVPFHWLDVERHHEARTQIEDEGLSARDLPVVLFHDGTQLVKPSIEELAERIGLHNQPESRFYDLIIIGAGPAGLAAGVYAASEGLHTVLVEREAPGGQAGTSASIENYPGFPSGLSGADLARRAVVQVQRFGGEILAPQVATTLQVDGRYRIVKLDHDAEICGHAVLITTGVSYRTLDVPGSERLAGAGVYYGSAMSEGEACRNEDVFIIGGGNSAGQAAMYFSRYARRVVMLVRGTSLEDSMSHYLIEELDNAPNVVVQTNTTVQEVHGDEHLEAVTITNSETGAVERLPTTTMFVFIGAVPHTDWLGDAVERDDEGYILTGTDVHHDDHRPAGWMLQRDPYYLETSIPGVFSAGDVRNDSVKRVTSAVGEGAMAVSFIHQYLRTI